MDKSTLLGVWEREWKGKQTYTVLFVSRAVSHQYLVFQSQSFRWTTSQLCCTWKQNVSSHPVQYLHKASHRSQSTSLWVPVMLVNLLTQLQATISHHFSSWKIILCQSCAGISVWFHFSKWRIIYFNHMTQFLKFFFSAIIWEEEEKWEGLPGWKESCVAWIRRDLTGRLAWICPDLLDRNGRPLLKGFLEWECRECKREQIMLAVWASPSIFKRNIEVCC